MLVEVVKYRGNIYGDVCMSFVLIYGELRKGYGILTVFLLLLFGDKNFVVDFFLIVIFY